MCVQYVSPYRWKVSFVHIMYVPCCEILRKLKKLSPCMSAEYGVKVCEGLVYTEERRCA